MRRYNLTRKTIMYSLRMQKRENEEYNFTYQW